MNEDDIMAFLELFIPVLYEDDIKKQKKPKIKKYIEVHKFIKEGTSKFVDNLCIDACQILWNNNIYTNDIISDEENITIYLNKLSSKNALEFEIKSYTKPECFKNENNIYKIIINKQNKSDEQIKKELIEAVSNFKIQDVEGGYLSKDNFLMKICDCGKVDGIKEYEPRVNLEINFDKNKMEKTFEEYLKEKKYENLYIKDEDRVYLDEYYLTGHKKYLESLK